MNLALLAPSLLIAASMPWWASNWFEMLIGAVVTIVLPFVLGLLQSKWKNNKALWWVSQGLNYVQAYWGLTIQQIEEKRADGQIDPAEIKQQKRQAMENLVNAFIKDHGGAKKVAGGLGVDVGGVQTAVRGLLERGVSTSKNEAKAARSGN